VLQPHRSRYWLNAQPDDPVAFERQVVEVCACYQAAPALREHEGTHTVSTDEMTGIQALERIAPTKPLQPGRPERREFEYQRHGTQCLIGNFEVATGEVLSPTVQPTRTEQDFAEHIARTVATDARAGWVFVVDNLTTHCSESLVKYVASACGLEGDLGKKGKRGVLKSVATRKAFLTDSSHRIRFVAQSDRDLVQHPGAAGAPARELHVGSRPAGEDPGVYRVFQPHVGQTVQVDVHGKAAQRVKRGKLGPRQEALGPSGRPILPGCTRG
jgi:DDE superfamily endonuclease